MLLFRRRRMIQRRRDHIRIVDDGFLIWNDTKGPRNFRTGIPLSLLNFRARLHRDTHLDFTWDDNCTKEAVFLDVTILKKHTHTLWDTHISKGTESISLPASLQRSSTRSPEISRLRKNYQIQDPKFLRKRLLFLLQTTFSTPHTSWLFYWSPTPHF